MFPLAMFGLGVPELLIILAVVLLLFGGSRLAGLGKSTGRALKEFKEETKGIKGADTTPGAGPAHQNPYETEAGSTFVQSPQAGSPYVAPPQGGAPYPQGQPDVTGYAQPPQTNGQQNGAGYGQAPQQGTSYGQAPQTGPAEHDVRRDV